MKKTTATTIYRELDHASATSALLVRLDVRDDRDHGQLIGTYLLTLAHDEPADFATKEHVVQTQYGHSSDAVMIRDAMARFAAWCKRWEGAK